MASFASQPVQFTPYIPDIDTNVYQQDIQNQIQVGMYKQQQYQLGVQKIQGLVDNIMGLQVSKDVDKEYLSNLQSETISNVRKIAGQDLSKQSLINQAGTYASAIFNDQNVRNAVASTQNMQDALAQIQKAHEEGKSGTSNDWAIMKRIQAWQNDGKVGSTLGKQQYTNYYDHTAELQKFLKDKNPNTIIKQEPFETNADGTPKWGAYALVEGKEVKLSSVDLQRDIQTFYMSNIQAKGQLDLDSGYYADHLDDTAAFQQFRQENESSLAALQREIKAYQDDSKMNPSNAAVNQTKILQLEEAFTKRQLMNRDSEAAFLRDPYSAKTALFQSNLMKGMADRYAYTDLQQKFVKNPIFDGMMEESRFNLQQADSNRAERRFQWEKEKWTLDFDQEERKMANNIKAAQIASGAIPVGGDYNAAAAEARTPEDRISELKAMGQSVAQQQMAMLYSMNPDNGVITIGTDSNDNTIYRLAQGKTQADVNNLFQQTQRSYDENPSGASREVRDFFGDPNNESYGIGKLRSWAAQTKQVDEIEANIERKLANSKGYRDYTDKLKSLGNSDEVLYRQGNTSLTRSDLVKFYENQTRTNFFWSPEDISRETGLSMDKVNALGLIINNEAETVVGDVLNAGRTLVSGFQYSPGGKEGEKLRKEFSRIKSLGGEEFAKLRKAEYQKYDKNYSGTTVAIPIDTKNRGLQESLIAFARLQPGNENFGNKVTSEKGGDITVIAHKNTAGEIAVTLKHSSGVTESTSLDAITTQQLIPQVLTTDPFQAQNTLLQANKGLYRNVPSVTGTSPTTAYPVRQLNEKYDFRFHIKQNESGNGFSPIGYYKEKTSKTWLPVPYEPPYMGQDEANTYYDNLIKQGTQYLETNLLK